MAPGPSNEYDEKGGQHGMRDDASPTLTNAPTVSDTAGDNNKEKDKEKNDYNPRADHPQYLSIPHTTNMAQDPTRLSPSESSREHATRLGDDLLVLQAEQAVHKQNSLELQRSGSKLRNAEPSADVFNEPAHQPTIELTQSTGSSVMSIFTTLKKLPRFFRYILYSLPGTLLLLIPILMGVYLPDGDKQSVGGEGGVQLLWFGIWLLVVWLSLWASRMVTSILPPILRVIGKLMGSGHPKYWRDVGRQIELHAALFLWMLACFISYHPILNNHKIPASGEDPFPDIRWIDIVYKVITAFFILSVLNFAEKILIQWVAITFHTRTYTTRISFNKQGIA